MRKRRRSIQRYEPANKRRRNTSSVSSPEDTRNRMADSDDEGNRGSPRRYSVDSRRATTDDSNEVGRAS